MNSVNNKQKAPALPAARTLATKAGSASPQISTRNQVIISRQPQQQQTSLTTLARPGARSNAYNNNNEVNRGYSKNNTNAISSQLSQHLLQQQSNPSFVIAPASQLPPNAPTSLANLAQLDGITLLPISNLNSISARNQQQNSSSSNLSPNVSIQSNQSTNSSIGAKNNNNNHRQRQQKPNQQAGQQLPNRLNMANNSNQDQITYNLANIPSIQMLNQTSSGEPIQSSWTNLTALASPPKGGVGQMARSSAQLQPTSSSSSLSNNYNNKSSSVQHARGRAMNNNHKVKTTSYLNSHQSTNDIQVIPVTETLPMFSDMSEMQMPLQSGNTNFDESILSQPRLNSDDSCVDVNGDMNNISLIKLMAILNNPALTVTAVDSRPSNNSNNSKPSQRLQTASSNYSDDRHHNHQQIAPAALNLVDSQQLSINLTSNIDNSFNNFKDKSYITAKDQNLPKMDVTLAKTRVPQSTANLNVIDGGLMANCSSTPSKRHNQGAAAVASLRNLSSIIAGKESSSGSFRQSNSSSSHRESDSQVNAWLSKNLNSSGSKISSFNQSSWSNSSNIDEGVSYQNEKLNDPKMLSTSVRNLMMQQLPAGAKQQTVSVQLLKHIANQSKDNDNWMPSLAASQHSDQKSILEPECILSVPRSVQQFSQEAKRVESSQTVTTSSISKKRPKQPILFTTHRLYVSRPEDNQPASKRRKIVSGPNFGLNEINVDGGHEREVHVSEQHLMLESMMSNETSGEKRRNAMPEPDDIFINRSKRVMSKIDTIIERKKRRRFERISGRAEPKTNSLEEQCAESEDEWSGDDDENVNVDYSCFIKTQLPLHEIETEEKRNHLLSVGLVSRNERNRLSVEHYEKKLQVFSPLAFEEPLGVPQDIQRLVDTLLKTGGTDIQLRIDSSIKRNDLPLIEGLNRNTSRMKMTYMSVLGLEKRSKRTTLYKVKNGENTGAMSKSVDLNKAPKSAAPFEPKQRMVELEAPVQMTVDRPIGNNSAIIAAKSSSAKLTSCREAIKPPSKNEYMKSLGLIAS